MWFAVHTKPRLEGKAIEMIEKTAGRSGLEEVFCPSAMVAIRNGDGWAEERRPMVPGLVVAVAPSKWELRRCIRQAGGMESVLATGTSYDAMEEGEAAFIDSLASPGDRCMALSEGVMEKGRCTVTSGPLAGREELIEKVSHRRKIAYLDASVAGVPVRAQVGLRLTHARQTPETGKRSRSRCA